MLEKRRCPCASRNLALKAFLACLSVLLPLTGLAVFPGAVHAQLNQSQVTVNQTAQAAGLANTTTDLPTIIGRIIYIILGTVGVIFLALLLFSGYQYMTAGGDPEKIKKAVTRIRNAVIGLIIIVFSFAIVNFILGWLTGQANLFGTVGGGNQTNQFNQWQDTGALGNNQIIEYHYPEPEQTNVPRNTAIVITFVHAIDPASFINGWTPGATTTGDLNSTFVNIHPESSLANNLLPNQAMTAVSPDHRTVMIKPKSDLGNAQNPTWYEIVLTNDILNASGTKVFAVSGLNVTDKTGYKWRFQVSTQEDNTPPRVVSVVPGPGGPYYRNIVIQINFSEPMFPLSVAGLYHNGGFQNIQIYQSDAGNNPQQINGEFRLSNGYRTVEFVTEDECGLNSCLVQMRCLPALKTINGLIKAASLYNNESALAAGYLTGQFNGAVDMAFNSLDGDGDGKATGPLGDPAGGFDDYPSSKPGTPPFSFLTRSEINRDPPFIKTVDPDPSAADNIAQDKNVDIAWLSDPHDLNGILLAYTVTSRSFRIYAAGPKETDPNSWWFFTKMMNIGDDGQEATSTTPHVQTKATIYHRPFAQSDIPQQGHSAEEYNNYYDPYVRHYVLNIYQNCYNPAAYYPNGVKTIAPAAMPNLCDNHASVGHDLGGGNMYCDFIKSP